VLSQALTLRVFAQQLPGFVAIHHACLSRKRVDLTIDIGNPHAWTLVGVALNFRERFLAMRQILKEKDLRSARILDSRFKNFAEVLTKFVSPFAGVRPHHTTANGLSVLFAAL
jgi:hypothetical protein